MAILLLSFFTSIVAIVVASVLYAIRRRKLIELIEKIPGPPAIAIFGNAHKFPFDRLGKKKKINKIMHRKGFQR